MKKWKENVYEAKWDFFFFYVCMTFNLEHVNMCKVAVSDEILDLRLKPGLRIIEPQHDKTKF